MRSTRLGMRETTFGWNLEMQMRAAAASLRIVEVPVGQRKRAGGVSKVSGDLVTAARAASVLVATFLRLAAINPPKPGQPTFVLEVTKPHPLAASAAAASVLPISSGRSCRRMGLQRSDVAAA